MKFGIQHGIGDPAWVPAILEPQAVKAFARSVEEVGWDALAFTDHPAPSVRWIGAGGEGIAEPFTSLGFCAAVTESIRLLTWVLVPAYRNPFLSAHAVATLDRLSAGRVTLGLGTGYLKSEMRALGLDPAERLRVFDETMDVMRRAWTTDEVDHESAGFSARGVRVIPPVVQQPHPPLWLHGNSPFGLARAARYAQGWIAMIGDGPIITTVRTTPIPDLDALRRRIDELRAATEAAGRPADDVTVIVNGHWPKLDIRQGWDVDAYLGDVARFAELGVEWLVMLVCGDDPGASEETVRAFGEQVVRPSADAVT